MKNRIVLLVAAVLLAAVGTVAIYSYTSRADSRAVAGQQAVAVLVASKSISQGASVTGSLTTTAKFPRKTVPSDAVTNVKQLDGLVATDNIQKQQLLTTSLFGEKKKQKKATGDAIGAKTAGVTVPKGMVAVPVSFSSLTKGLDWLNFVQPGAHVAIFVTYVPIDPRTGKALRSSTDATGTDDKSYDHATTLIIPKAKVLGVGDNVTPSTTSKPNSTDAKALLLALSQHDSERLILAIGMSQPLYPVLLTKDSTVKPTSGIDQFTILRSVGKD